MDRALTDYAYFFLMIIIQIVGMDPELRHWWRLLEDFPSRIRHVYRWTTPHRRPASTGTFHAVPTLIACLQGVVRMQVSDGPTLDLNAGDVLVIAGGVWHEHADLRPGSIWFGQGFMAAWSDVALGTAQRKWIGKLPTDPSRSLMEATLTATDEPAARRMVAGLVGQVLTESVTALDWERPELVAMIDTLWRRCHLGVTVEDLVRASGLRRAQAYAVFTKGFGVTPKEAIATARLWLAGSYLAAGMGVGEAARLAGYPSADTFGRCWRREHGSSPRAALVKKLVAL